MFTQQTINFLVENKLQNSKEWYAAHKEDYKRDVFEPMAEFVRAITPTIYAIDDLLICEPKVDRSISRIYRDTRFSKDKSLYRDNIWCVFIRDKKLYQGPPAFYFDLSPNGFDYGCGYYEADSRSLDAMRDMIIKNDPAFREAFKAYEKQDMFTLTGDRYKRSKYPDFPENIRDWLDRKGMSFNHYSTDFELMFSDRLVDKIAEGFKLLEPVYKFMMKAESR